MNQRLIAEIGRTQRLEILNSLKRTRGLSVNELVEKMNMSYMGIKQHCLTLQRDGYLDTWRRPQKMGRPEMVYRLTRRTHEVFEKKAADLTAKAKGETVTERAKWLARVRDSEGCMAQFTTTGEGGPQILECHSPIMNLLDRYPIIARFEQDMFEAVLGTKVRREETRNSGLYECAFYFAV